MVDCEIIAGDCIQYLNSQIELKLDLSFLDPPFNQGKDYDSHDDDMPSVDYWNWMRQVCEQIYNKTSEGGAIYFMQREKNTQYVLDTLNSTGWTFQNLIIWKKKTSAVPCNNRFGKHYQIIAFATKGKKPKHFNKLRIDPILLVTEKYKRPNGMFITDVWDDIRELTSGYFAGDEPLRSPGNQRLHKQQSPIQLLLRIILSSTKVDDVVFDPFAGTGTTLVVSKQLGRHSIGVEIDPKNVSLIKKRISSIRKSDNIAKYRTNYKYTQNLNKIWKSEAPQKYDVINQSQMMIEL
ncbi:MAG: site-specific DNA-methyltransferase [Ignavibacteriales bacterium]|nr:site-specific DNA-methyltransferase [Ignavibacteriales bacterium]